MNKGIALLFILMLVGCGSAPYQSAHENKGYGYYDQQLSKNVYRLHYQCGRGDSSGKASDFALLRAAELALENNYSHFVILKRDDETRNRSSHIRGRRETTINFDEYDSSTGNGRGEAVTHVTGGSTHRYSEARSLLLVELSQGGDAPEGKVVYNAAYVKSSISQKYQLNK